MRAAPRWRALLAVALAGSLLGGCVTLPRTAFTAGEQAAASPVGFGQVRYAEDDPGLAAMLGRTLKPDGAGEVDVLAISGGGANGAFGAGLLYGWSRTGQRPRFELVTGVSAGALAAPFAFLGPDWNERLRQTYFAPPIHNLLQSRGLLGLFTPGLFRKAPLNRLVHAYVTDDLVKAVAAEHAKGRRLLVATTDLDTGKLVVWDMGAIASSPGPGARALFAQVLIASATVPGVFAPTMIEVEGGGRRFSEMHVDGQADSAFFAIPETLFLGVRPAGPRYNHRLFILVNGQLASPFDVTPLATVPILRRTIDVTAKASIRAAMITTLQFCQLNACDLSVASMPESQTDDALDFGDAHIRSLFSAGQAIGESGRAWTLAAPTLLDAAKPQAPAATSAPAR